MRNREVSIHGTIHDPKAPLASVLLTLGFIKDSIEDMQLQELLHSSEKKIQNLANTIKTILITAKAGENKLALNKEPVNLMELAKLAQEQVDSNYADKPHSIHIHDCRTCKEEIPADRYLIENVLGNPIENAVKYSEAEADIEVSIRSDEHFAIVSVKTTVSESTENIRRRFSSNSIAYREPSIRTDMASDLLW